MNRRIRGVVGAFVVLAVLSGCAKSTHTAERAATDRPTAPARTTTTSTPAVAKTTTTTVPVGHEDFLAIVRHIFAIADRAGETVDESLIDQIDDPQCPCYAHVKSMIRDLASRHEHDAGEPFVIHSVEVVNRVSPQFVIARVVASQGPNWIVGPDGNRVRDAPTFGPTRFIMELALKGSVWRLLDTTEEGPAE